MSALAEWPESQQYPTINPELKLSRFDQDIKRFAHFVAHLAAPHAVDSEDLAQEARLHLLKVDITGRSEAYVRSVIFNATREARRAELRFFVRREPKSEANTDARVRPPSLEDSLGIIDVQRFVDALPSQFQQVYHALYVRNCDQRKAAGELGISQARVAQLHAELLRRGRAHFGVAVN